MRATGEGFGTLGLGDKMDLIQMMLDCVETMTSVLHNVTNMGINVNTLRKCFKQSRLNSTSWLTFSITLEVTLLKPLNVRINSSIRVLDQSISGS